MKYDVIEEREIENLVETINKKIKEGWEPIGGIAVSGSDGDFYTQAIIYRDDQPQLLTEDKKKGKK